MNLTADPIFLTNKHEILLKTLFQINNYKTRNNNIYEEHVVIWACGGGRFLLGGRFEILGLGGYGHAVLQIGGDDGL